ncbi:leucine-rich repeat protein kinase family protein [Striga asiatica]|uniref:non-specific serine/threonine protein kinase n=1 Tax=Striga asiatica TaxID=4170 RepID=A0A5A7Q0C6_STRAF|nr:leucine-rich repeat protein kinase family protein [Striga asiatica]
MSEDEADIFKLRVVLLWFLILITDKQVLLSLRSFLEQENPISAYQAKYTHWNANDTSPCGWPGIRCDSSSERVTAVDLSGCSIAGNIFRNFSALTELSYLDLSQNTIGGALNEDLSRCLNLKFLNLSHNIMNGELNLTGLSHLEVLDLSVNRMQADIRLAVPLDCSRLVAANISDNNFTGSVGRIFKTCWNLRYLDLSVNRLTGNLWAGLDKLVEVSLSENEFFGLVPGWIFSKNCSLTSLDLSENQFSGRFPAEISNCIDLNVLNLGGNRFNDSIPREIGYLPGLEALYLGNNSFSREIPETLLGLRKLLFLDLSRNRFGGDVQPIFGLFKTVKFLLLHHNSYSGGLYTSGILALPNVSRLDLSFNNFTGPLPVEFSQMPSLKFLILSSNRFNGTIPSEYGSFRKIQALDLSFNNLTGPIPPSLGRLKSLLWLMLANNSLTGEIPWELGNCSSLLWLNLANNGLSGPIPRQLARIGSDPMPTFMANRANDVMPAGSGECLAMKRWIPADYPPFSFVYVLLTRKKCRSLWDRILKGYGLFSICLPGSNVRTNQLSGYIQLSRNRLSGKIPVELGKMLNFSMLHLGLNSFHGELPSEIGQLPLVVLNVSSNVLSGNIPIQIGNLKCLQNLDLSNNNFSGPFPNTLNNLNELIKFNVSYNPYVSGAIPSTGQLATFDKSSFFGNPLLRLPPFFFEPTSTTTNHTPFRTDIGPDNPSPRHVGLFIASTLAFLVCGVLTLIVWLVVNSPTRYFIEDSKDFGSNTVEVIRLDKKTAFTHSDILEATRNFSSERIIGMGGSGTVYRGTLPDGRQVAVKKLQSEGLEGEREFRAEMEVLSVNGPHPNLVTLYGWCLNGPEKLLVYEYMEGGSLEELVADWDRLDSSKRLEVAADVARALVFLHHECFPSVVHRDVKASNVLLDKNGRARVTDFGLARIVDDGGSHVSTMVAGTVGYVAPEYGQTWRATTKGDVYSFGVLAMELATGRRAVDGGEEEECLVEWAKRVNGVDGLKVGLGPEDGVEKMGGLLRVGMWCTAEKPSSRPNMKEVLALLYRICFGGTVDGGGPLDGM